MHAKNTCRLRALGAVLMLVAAPASGLADRLFTLNVSGSLHEVSQSSGTASLLLDDLTAGSSWNALAAAPNDDNLLFAIHNPRPQIFDDPQLSRLVSINVETSEVTFFPVFDSLALDVEDPFASGLAIRDVEPNIGYVVGSNSKAIPPVPHLWRIDLTTGAVLSAADELTGVQRLEAIAFSPGGTLYGTNQSGELVTVDRDNHTVATVGDAGLTSFLTGLAFEPNTGELFAIDGGSSDTLVTLDPDTGALERTIGTLTIQGPEGLAFLPDLFSPLDCDLSGDVGTSDLDCANASGFTGDLLATLQIWPGDLNGMNGVNFDDFIVFADSFGRDGRTKYTQGDINADGTVNFDDFVIFAANYGRPPLASGAAGEFPVPEPGTLGPLLAALLLASGKGRRRRA